MDEYGSHGVYRTWQSGVHILDGVAAPDAEPSRTILLSRSDGAAAGIKHLRREYRARRDALQQQSALCEQRGRTGRAAV